MSASAIIKAIKKGVLFVLIVAMLQSMYCKMIQVEK